MFARWKEHGRSWSLAIFLSLAVRWLFCLQSRYTRFETSGLRDQKRFFCKLYSSPSGRSALCWRCYPLPRRRCYSGEISSRLACFYCRSRASTSPWTTRVLTSWNGIFRCCWYTQSYFPAAFSDPLQLIPLSCYSPFSKRPFIKKRCTSLLFSYVPKQIVSDL